MAPSGPLSRPTPTSDTRGKSDAYCSPIRPCGEDPDPAAARGGRLSGLGAERRLTGHHGLEYEITDRYATLRRWAEQERDRERASAWPQHGSYRTHKTYDSL